MLISLLKGQAMNEAWKEENPTVAALLLSRYLPVQNPADLFTRSKNAEPFTAELESYIRSWFKVITNIY